MAQQTIAINLIGNSSSLTGALRQASTAWQSLDARMEKVMSGQVKYTAGLRGLQDMTTGRTVPSLKVMRAEIEKVRTEKENLAKTIKWLSENLNKEEMEILGLSGAMKQLNGGMKNLHAGAGTAQFAVTSLGQTFADMGQFGMGAAQGIRAINNNVQMTVQAMIMAGQANDGFVNGLKAMGKAIAGPGGLMIVFFAVSAAVEFFANKSQKAKQEVDGFAKSLGGLTSALGPNGFQASAAGLSRVAQASTGVFNMFKTALDAMDQAVMNIRVARYQELLEKGMPAIRAWDSSASAIRGVTEAMAEARAAVEADVKIWEADSKEKIKAAEDAAKLERAYNMLVVAMGVEGVLGAMQAQSREFAESNWIQMQAKAISDAIDKTRDLQEQIRFLRGPDGIRIASLTIQARKLQEQVEWQQHLNELAAEGVEVAGIEDIGLTFRDAGVEEAQDQIQGLFRFAATGMAASLNTASMAGRFDWAKIMGYEGMAAQMKEEYDEIAGNTEEFGEDYAKGQAKIAAENAKAEARFNAMGASLISAAAGIAGGKDAFLRSFGQFLTQWSKQLIQTGIAATGFGKAMLALRASFFEGPAGALKAIAAGIALAAIGRKLRASASRAASPGGGGGVGAGGFAAPGFTRPGVGGMVPVGAGGGLLPAAAYSGNSATQVSGRFVVQGRDLVAAVKNETDFQSSMGMGNNLVIGG